MVSNRINTIDASIGKSPLLYAAMLLGIPFIIVFVYTHGLSTGLDPIFSVDEGAFHYPTILQFAKQLPFPDVRDYNSATTPLFHILFACLSKITGDGIQHLRMINFLITYATVVLFFRILITEYKISFKNAFLFTLVFALSPYFFREAFVVLTDNLPILWLLLFFHFYFKYKEKGSTSLFGWSMLFIMLLCLTRQTYLYVWLAVVIDLLRQHLSSKNKLKSLSLCLIAAMPTFALFYVWKGLTPPAFIKFHTRTSLLNVKAIAYGFSVIGFYAMFILNSGIYMPFLKKEKNKIIIAIALAWILLYFFPLVKMHEDFGYLWYIAAPLPKIQQSSILFYILTALGVCSFLSIWQKEGMSFYMLFILGLLFSEVPNKFIFQRYYDSSILIFLIFINAKYHVSNKSDYYRRAILIVFFIAYFVVFTAV